MGVGVGGASADTSVTFTTGLLENSGGAHYQYGDTFYPVDGTMITYQFSGQTASGSGSYQTGLWCNGVSIDYSLAGAYGPVTFAATTGSHASGCKAYDWQDGTRTLGRPTFVISYFRSDASPAPEPTAFPNPTATPRPTAQPTDATGFAVTAECGHGAKTSQSYGYNCSWATAAYNYSTSLSTAAGGPACVDFVSIACRLDDSGGGFNPSGSNWMNMPVGQHGSGGAGSQTSTVVAVNRSAVTAITSDDAGTAQVTAASAKASWRCRDSSSSGYVACTWAVVVAIDWTINNGTVREAAQFFCKGTAGCSDTGTDSHFVTTTPIYAVPANTANGFRIILLCVGGTGCNTPNQTPTRFTHVDSIEAFVYTDSTPSGADPNAIACPDPHAPACVTVPGTTDPNTGLLICGPLSGDCSKPFVSPIAINACVAPGTADPLGAVQWLSYIACLIGNVGGLLYNAITVPILNVLIDLWFPGAGLGQAVQSFRDEVGGRAPFSWIFAFTDQISGAIAAPDAGDSLPTSVELYGHTVEVGDGMAAVTDRFADFRPWLTVLVWLYFAWWVFQEIQGWLGRHPQGTLFYAERT